MNKKIKIQFPDGDQREYSKGITPGEIVNQISKGLAKNTIVSKFNDELHDLNRPLEDDGKLLFIGYDDAEGLETYWHSTSHIMAHAIKELFPDAKFGFGPAIENGFYYDIELDKAITPDDLDSIENKMQEIIDRDNIFIRKILNKDEALKLFDEKNEKYKVEHISDLNNRLSIYKEGEFVDLCSGPHVPSTNYIKYFKLLNIAGAYWKGDESRPMLQRIYGISFPKKKQLDDFLEKLEEAKKRDHRKLGKELDLFTINDEIGAGLILWHPKGALMRKIIEDFWRDAHLKRDYELVFTPHIARLNLWDKSGHLDFFAENMFAPLDMENVKYQIKPMNCPFHLAIYKSQTRSYKDLPIRWAELGTVYRYERSGVLHGLMRVRGFTQDDAHVFCRQDQLQQEILNCLDITTFVLHSFGFDKYEVYLSTRPEKFVGTEENWDKATTALKNALEEFNLDYEIDPGEGVFYGPKIDIKIKDVLERSWQCSTIQVDFNEPERFNITFRGQDGFDHQPIMIHRALMGSLERFFGVLIEHYGGAFPIWLSPLQVVVLPITDNQHEYAKEIELQLKKADIRVKIDDRNEKIGYKIREAELQKIPYMLVIGDAEVNNKKVAVRKRREGDQGAFDLTTFIERISSEIENKSE
ncbi:threonine--tRNA ligase [candidate division KSB1 bacterium]|nr:threonine--tRNA ligase [candidate division KSB1 bacterium]